MIVSFMRERYDNIIYAVILSYETTTDEIQEIIDTIESENESDYTFDDIKSALPKDCTIIEVGDEFKNSVYY